MDGGDGGEGGSYCGFAAELTARRSFYYFYGGVGGRNGCVDADAGATSLASSGSRVLALLSLCGRGGASGTHLLDLPSPCRGSRLGAVSGFCFFLHGGLMVPVHSSLRVLWALVIPSANSFERFRLLAFG